MHIYANREQVSMVDGDLFDKLASIACILRRSAKPFGGIQVGSTNMDCNWIV